MQLVVGPAAIGPEPADVAKGDYTVKATFKRREVGRGPSALGRSLHRRQRPRQGHADYIYCVAYTDASAMVRQFTGSRRRWTLLRKTAERGVKAPDASGGATNDIAWFVKGGKADCQINGTSVASYDLAKVNIPSFDGSTASA